MAKIFNGRYTAKTDQPFVVFLIGMRINQWWRFDKWLPVEFFWNFSGPIIVQYWRSFDDLERFARQPSEPHLEPWKKFNQAVGKSGMVGIWHETYLVNPDQFESVYGNMPLFGLGAALEHVEATGAREAAKLRLSANKAA